MGAVGGMGAELYSMLRTKDTQSTKRLRDIETLDKQICCFNTTAEISCTCDSTMLTSPPSLAMQRCFPLSPSGCDTTRRVPVRLVGPIRVFRSVGCIGSAESARNTPARIDRRIYCGCLCLPPGAPPET